MNANLPAPNVKFYDSNNEAQTRRMIEQHLRSLYAQQAVTASAVAPIGGVAGEALSAGEFVAFNASGEIVLADASTNDLLAVGFVLHDYADNDPNVRVYPSGSNSLLSGLTEGDRYYLSTTPGAVTATPPTGNSPVIVQQIGVAYSATSLLVNIQQAIELP